MLDRRRLLSLALPVLLAPSLALAQGATQKKKGGGITYIQFPP
jgi:hypothetical protein